MKTDPIRLPDKIKAYQDIKEIIRDLDDMAWKWNEGELTAEDYLKWAIPRITYAKEILDTYILKVLQ